MALIFMESFDGYGGTAAHMTKYAQAPTLTTTPTPRTGTHCARGGLSRDFPYQVTSGAIIVGYALYWVAGSVGHAILHTAHNATYQTTLKLLSDGRLQVLLGNENGTILQTSAVVMVGSSWNFIEWKTVVANSGSWTVKCNGAIVLNGTGDTQNHSTTTVGNLFFSGPPSGQGLDDLYVLDASGSYNNDFIGDCKVECLSAQAGNGANVGLTCSTGTDHGALVDESPANDDTDYNYSATAGAKDTYAFTNVATVGAIRAVQVSARARKTDSATKELALVARVSGGDYDGATEAVAAITYGQYLRVWDRRPNDSGAWTIADVNAAEFGLKVVS